MARFSLSPGSCRRPSTDRTRDKEPAVPEWKWTFPPEDYRQPRSDDDSSSSSEDESHADEGAGGTYDGDDSDSSSCDGDEWEPPHPLGFESRFGRTRFGLSPQSTARMAKTRDIFNRDDEYAWNALIHIDRQEPRSPFDSYLSHAPARGSGLVLDSRNHGCGVDDLVSSMDRIASLVKAASYTDQRSEYSTPSATHRTPLSSLSPRAQPRSTSKLLELAAECERRQQSMSRQTSQLKQQQTRSFEDSCRGFMLLLQADASRASSASERISQRLQDREAFEERERLAAEEHEARVREEREQAAKEEEERLAAARALSEEERKREEQRLEKLRQAEREAEEEEAEKSAHITRATDLISMLDEARSTLKDFDKNKSVGKRRLQFKKIVNGRINTLAHDEGKIRDVARIVSEAIDTAGRDDAVASGDPVMSMGKKYLLDLLASNLIVRVQADGFNGTRGDGFPLAAMFAITSTTCEELLPVLEAHLYTVCPMTIPVMSLKGDGDSSGGDESDLMESLGMLKDKNGEYESFDKFLSRTGNAHKYEPRIWYESPLLTFLDCAFRGSSIDHGRHHVVVARGTHAVGWSQRRHAMDRAAHGYPAAGAGLSAAPADGACPSRLPDRSGSHASEQIRGSFSSDFRGNPKRCAEQAGR